jgi:hypothetical protein
MDSYINRKSNYCQGMFWVSANKNSPRRRRQAYARPGWTGSQYKNPFYVNRENPKQTVQG